LDIWLTPGTQLANDWMVKVICEPPEGEDLSRLIIANKPDCYRLLREGTQEQAREPWVIPIYSAECASRSFTIRRCR
jgi:hypothetical protein